MASGPEVAEVKLKYRKAIIEFNNVGNGLETKSINLDGNLALKGRLIGFAICGKNKKWQWAQAKIVSENKIKVWNEDIKKPMAVRYAWSNFPICNLYNSVGLPAVPFRTDDFPPVNVKSNN